MLGSDGDFARMNRDLASAARGLKGAKNVLVISHIDADGITAGSIANITLDRMGVEHRVRFVPKLDEETINLINNAPEDYVWICDLGSGYLSEFGRPNLIVTDHHVPDPKWRKKQTVLGVYLLRQEIGHSRSADLIGSVETV